MGAPSRRLQTFRYRIRTSWRRAHRVVAKAKHLAKGPNPHFVVASLGREAARLQRLHEQLYCARDDVENRKKESQIDLFADRKSTTTLHTNQLRLHFAPFAYVLMHGQRRLGLTGAHWARAQCGTPSR